VYIDVDSVESKNKTHNIETRKLLCMVLAMKKIIILRTRNTKYSSLYKLYGTAELLISQLIQSEFNEKEL
jgi:hypothetical protein